MDNATTEHVFISSFFSNDTSLPLREPNTSTQLLSLIVSPDGGSSFSDMRSPSGSDFGQQPLSSTFTSTTPGLGGFVSFVARSKEEQAAIDTIWKQVMDPVMNYSQVCHI